jgi:RING-type zinc-finger/Deltex C-terminal domain
MSRHRMASTGSLEDLPYDKEKLGTGRSAEYDVTCCVCDQKLRRSSAQSNKYCSHYCCPQCVKLPCNSCYAAKQPSIDSATVEPAENRSRSASHKMAASDGGNNDHIPKVSSSRRQVAMPEHSSGSGPTRVTDTEVEKRLLSSSSTDRQSEEDENCPICMDKMFDPKALPCNHKFCRQCIDEAFVHARKCPCCARVFGTLKGNQPEGGKMEVTKLHKQDLEGFKGDGSIRIDYYIPSGLQEVGLPSTVDCRINVYIKFA